MQNLLKFLTNERVLEEPPEPRRDLTFSPLAWLKLQLFLHAGQTEVGGFGISSEDDLLYITDFATVGQSCTAVTVRFDDSALADYFDTCVDAGLTPNRFARIWIHTHPGESPAPSCQDEETFARVFGRCDWAVMFILSRTGRTYARMSFGAGPGGRELLETTVDWAAWPAMVIEEPEPLKGRLCDWIAEYSRNVRVIAPPVRWANDDFAEDPSLNQVHRDLWVEEAAAALFDAAERSDGWGTGVAR